MAEWRHLIVLLPLAAGACVPHRQPDTAPGGPTLDRAAALVHEGCYPCLTGALDVYEERVASSGARQRRAAATGGVDAALLLALRQKELGLDPSDALRRAENLRRLAEPSNDRTPSPSRRRLDALFAAVRVFPSDASGLDVEQRIALEITRPESVQQVADAAARIDASEASADDSLAAYVRLALTCVNAQATASDPPLLRYRRALCRHDTTTLSALRDADPRWAETAFFEAETELSAASRSPDPERAAAWLQIAATTLPDSPGLHMLAARAQELLGNAAGALEHFEAVLRLHEVHLDAQLGRTRSLTTLGRHAEAIEAATALIAAGTWNVGDAYYWRAWNHFDLGQQDDAWGDVGQALTRLANSPVHALAGSIAYRRGDTTTALEHFDRAVSLDPMNCMAASSGASITSERGDWTQAATRFATTSDCFAAVASRAHRELDALQQTTLAPSVRDRRSAETRARAESAERQSAEAAMNAANSFLRLGRAEEATPFLERAARDPGIGDRVRSVIGW